MKKEVKNSSRESKIRFKPCILLRSQSLPQSSTETIATGEVWKSKKLLLPTKYLQKVNKAAADSSNSTQILWCTKKSVKNRPSKSKRN